MCYVFGLVVCVCLMLSTCVVVFACLFYVCLGFVGVFGCFPCVFVCDKCVCLFVVCLCLAVISHVLVLVCVFKRGLLLCDVCVCRVFPM